jgi:hypothetical protein
MYYLGQQRVCYQWFEMATYNEATDRTTAIKVRIDKETIMDKVMADKVGMV